MKTPGPSLSSIVASLTIATLYGASTLIVLASSATAQTSHPSAGSVGVVTVVPVNPQALSPHGSRNSSRLEHRLQRHHHNQRETQHLWPRLGQQRYGARDNDKNCPQRCPRKSRQRRISWRRNQQCRLEPRLQHRHINLRPPKSLGRLPRW
jgi:hypothetical protein